MNEHRIEPVWRDPLSLGWQAHRGLLMLRLRWHSSAQRRRTDGQPPHPRPALPRIGLQRHHRSTSH